MQSILETCEQPEPPELGVHVYRRRERWAWKPEAVKDRVKNMGFAVRCGFELLLRH